MLPCVVIVAAVGVVVGGDGECRVVMVVVVVGVVDVVVDWGVK